MKIEVMYEPPKVEVVKMQVGQAVLSSSFSGEKISGWEDM